MNGIVHWNPFREMQELQHRLNTLMEASFGRRTDGGETLLASQWQPAVDIVEDNKEYIIRADLPGVNKQDVRVTIDNSVVRLEGERKQQAEAPDQCYYHQMECPYGKFQRNFALPGEAATGQIHAEFKDGILRIRVPKSESSKPKQITVT
jgi:HSP20 family protein